MFGFVRKREVEELRRQVDSLCMTILADRVNGKERICKVREECLNYTQKIDNFHSEHIELILRHLGLRFIRNESCRCGSRCRLGRSRDQPQSKVP